MSKERECIICGKKYEYCPNCGKYNLNEKWRMIYCSEDCMEIDKIRDQYKAGKLTVSEAKNKLAKVNVPAISAIKDWARETISEIIKDTKEEIVLDEAPIEEIILIKPIEEKDEEALSSEVVEEVKFEQPRYNKNRKNKYQK